MTRRSVRAFAGSAFAILGGLLMLVGGVANHSFLLSLLDLVSGRLGALGGGVPLLVLLVTIYAVSVLISLGGLTVMTGGVMIFSRHIGTGRLLIALGGGAGFLGLFVSFGYTAFTTGLSSALSHSVYWAGLMMSVVARGVAKNA